MVGVPTVWRVAAGMAIAINHLATSRSWAPGGGVGAYSGDLRRWAVATLPMGSPGVTWRDTRPLVARWSTLSSRSTRRIAARWCC